MSLSPFINTFPNWQNAIKDRFVLFDTNAIIGIMEFKAVDIMGTLKIMNSTNCYIDPVHVELLNTQSTQHRIDRRNFLNIYSFKKLPLDVTVFEKTAQIQKTLSAKNTIPAITDLYLGGRLAAYLHDKILLLTANLRDFPYPLFNRVAYILLQNNKACTVLNLLSFNHAELAV